MTNCAFTIVAKNYIGLAMILEEYIKKYYTDLDFFIIVADEPDSEMPELPDNVIFAKDELCIDNKKWYEMAFKYDLTEFCTAIKPDSILHFLSKGYEKVIYLDPDIYFFSSIAPIFESLNEHIVILTPHITTMPVLGATDSPERDWMKCGIYNLGFIGVTNNPKIIQMLNWWKDRLRDGCFIDDKEGQYTDQKWMDFIPAFFDDSELFITKHLGMNFAPWNFFERIVNVENGKFVVSYRQCIKDFKYPLMFVHFSGYDYKLLKSGINRQKNIECLQNYNDINSVITEYSQAIKDKQAVFDLTIENSYTYNYFEDGKTIHPYHRRLYRSYLLHSKIDNPFKCCSYFYKLLSNKRLLKYKYDSNAKILKKDYKNLSSKLKKINIAFRILYLLLGPSKYFLFLRFLRSYSRPESQLHILESQLMMK